MRTPTIAVALWMSTGLLAAADWPQVGGVEVQPLLAQVRRVDTALETLGQPLPNATRKSLAAWTAADGAKATRGIQELLDPHCLAAVEIDEKGVFRVVPSPHRLGLERFSRKR